jgi:hypothetical protein
MQFGHGGQFHSRSALTFRCATFLKPPMPATANSQTLPPMPLRSADSDDPADTDSFPQTGKNKKNLTGDTLLTSILHGDKSMFQK